MSNELRDRTETSSDISSIIAEIGNNAVARNNSFFTGLDKSLPVTNLENISDSLVGKLTEDQLTNVIANNNLAINKRSEYINQYMAETKEVEQQYIELIRYAVDQNMKFKGEELERQRQKDIMDTKDAEANRVNSLKLTKMQERQEKLKRAHEAKLQLEQIEANKKSALTKAKNDKEIAKINAEAETESSGPSGILSGFFAGLGW